MNKRTKRSLSKQRTNQSNTKKKIIKVSAALAVLLLIAAGTVTNFIPFAYNVVRCGQFPIESSTFAASYSYRKPGDAGYGVHAFSSYGFCTVEEIEATNGYHRQAQ